MYTYVDNYNLVKLPSLLEFNQTNPNGTAYGVK